MSQTSRSSHHLPTCWNGPDAVRFFSVLRLVLRTQPRSGGGGGGGPAVPGGIILAVAGRAAGAVVAAGRGG